MSLRECAVRLSDNLARALPHQRMRTERLRRDLGLAAGQPLFGPQVNVMPFYGDLVFDQVRAPTTTLCRGPFEDMSIVVSRHDDGHAIRISIDADPDLYRPEDLDAHLARFAGLLGTVERQLDTCLGALELVVPGPRRRGRADWERVDELSDEEVDRLLSELAEETD